MNSQFQKIEMISELQKYFQLLYDNLRFPVQVVDSDGKIIYINEAFSLLWGYTHNELSEYSVFSDSKLRETGILFSINEIFNGKSYSNVSNYSDSLISSKEYAVPILKTSITLLNHFEKKYAILIHEDITEIILTNEEVKKAREANKEAERLKNNFLNVLSHELRTPLNIILGYSSLIRENLGDKVNAEEKVYLDNLHSGSERLFKSITQMLEFAQLEAGNYSLNIETIDLISVFQSNLNEHKNAAQEKNIQIKTNFTKKKVYVDIDVQCVEHAFNNLMGNALKFTHQGFVEVEVNVLEDKDLAVCRVRDSGIGISTNYMDHLYQPFSQEDLNVGRHFEGNGLGLALAKRYIEKLGGSLLVDSIKGVGTTFTFTIPLTQNLNYKKKILAEENILNPNQILMLDDSGESSGLVKAFLKNEYDIVHYSLRNFKLEFIRDINFSYVIFDVNKNYWQQGIMICNDIKKNDPYKRPIIVISSEYIEEKIKEFYNAGAKKFLVKPFGKAELQRVIKEATN